MPTTCRCATSRAASGSRRRFVAPPRSARRPGSDVPDTASLLFVSGGYLSALSNRTSLGRVLSAADDAPGAPPVAVVSHGWWSRTAWRGDPSIVGQQIWLNGTPFTVVGVSERGFTGTADTPPAMWVTLANYHVVLRRTAARSALLHNREHSGPGCERRLARAGGSGAQRCRLGVRCRPPGTFRAGRRIFRGRHATAIARAPLRRR